MKKEINLTFISFYYAIKKFYFLFFVGVIFNHNTYYLLTTKNINFVFSV